MGDTSSHGVSLVAAGNRKAQARFPTILGICVSRSRFLEYNFFLISIYRSLLGGPQSPLRRLLYPIAITCFTPFIYLAPQFPVVSYLRKFQIEAKNQGLVGRLLGGMFGM